EFEQGRPVLEAIKKERPELPVLLTFFSPSGYEARKHFKLATQVEYLPADSASNAARLVKLVEPKAAIFIKYEFWYHYLQALKRADIPTYLVSAIFRPSQPFFKWYGKAWREMLACFSQIFTQDNASRDLLASIGVKNVLVSGDTRFDRVNAIASSGGTEWGLVVAKAFKGNHRTLVCGSTWPKDEVLLLDALARLPQRPKVIVAPHEIDPEQLRNIEARFPKPLVRLSELDGTDPANIAATLGQEATGTLLVDRMGLLARLYEHGDLAYIGGGFGDGIHSLLEAAAWGKPVIFGPRHTKFTEAKGLIDCGGGFEVRDADDLRAVLGRLLNDEKALAQASAAAAMFVRQRTGATALVKTYLLGSL
ncbi:MAG: 3-deoxy-D-manno-octulosonic acid transferase, partial [Flavobacteriales bacterium]|nr:3-deoxy-D-manno-octulosonic acid transferase [Flavobacteriales bacterium]